MKLFMSKIASVFLFLLLSPQSSFAISAWANLADYEAPEQKRFVFIICSRSNARWVEKNLHSAFMQDYPRDKFRFIYFDDNSPDGTADLVFAYVTARNEWDRFILIRNDTWQSIMLNHYRAAYLCDDDEIIVHLDGDDFMKHDKVLWLLNKVYNKWDVWLTYGQYENWPVPELGFSIDVPQHMAEQNQFREMGFWYSHLRTFYAWLFKKIKLKDLIWRGSFIPTTPNIDYMMMFPMMEMAGDGHFRFISDVLYCYNRTNSLSTCNMPIKIELAPARLWQKYQPLPAKENIITCRRQHEKADVIIYSCDDPNGLKEFIRNELEKIKGINSVLILFRASSDKILKQYQELSLPHNGIIADLQRSFLEDYISCLINDYCLVITDTSMHMQECSMADCVYELERTNAVAFFLGLSKKSFEPCNEKINYGPFPEAQIDYRLAFLGNGIAAWQFEYETYVWEDPALDKAVLLRKKDLENNLQLAEFGKETFKKCLYMLMCGEREIGLLFEKRRAISCD